MLHLPFCFRATFLKDQTALGDFPLELALLLLIRLHQREQCAFLVTLHICHQDLILRAEVAHLVPQT